MTSEATATPSSGTEWRNYWTVALAAALGNSITVLHVYSVGPFMAPLEQEFGWNRAQISLGLTISATIGATVGILVGILLDRWGPRRVGLIGITIMCSAYAMLGTATGSIANWLFLWGLMGIGGAWIKPTIWTSAVASRFDAARGLAIAITVSGAGFAATIIPALTTTAIAELGWRHAFFAIGGLWAAVLLPVLFLFFHGAQDPKKGQVRHKIAGDAMEGMTLAEGLRSGVFYKLGAAGMVFALAVIGLVVHFIPVLQDIGIGRMTAASIAGLVGLSSIAGRLGTGFLLDRFRAEKVGMIAFSLPALAALLLLTGGESTLTLSVAAAIIGLSLGSELDVVMYLATRHFGLKRFGVLFATMLIFLSVGTALGPVLAGTIFDRYGSYTYFIYLIFPLVILGSILIGTLKPYPVYKAPPQSEPT